MIIDGFLCSFDFPLIYDSAWVLPAENQTILYFKCQTRLRFGHENVKRKRNEWEKLTS